MKPELPDLIERRNEQLDKINPKNRMPVWRRRQALRLCMVLLNAEPMAKQERALRRIAA